MLRVTLFVVASLALSACALTRVTDATHAAEVNKLNAVGLSLETARLRATEQGFKCNTHTQENVSVQTEIGTRKSTVLECNKASLELMCPQRRYVVFNADHVSNQVYSVGSRIVQRSCF